MLLSQERVLTLLYDKTFPPRPATAKISGLRNSLSQGQNQTGICENEDLRQFKYYGSAGDGKVVENIDEEDVELLEKDIEEVMIRAHKDKLTQQEPDIINISGHNKKV